MRGLATIAGGLCKHDALGARGLFHQANDSLLLMYPTWPESHIAEARRTLLKETGSCDPALAQEFAARSPEQKRATSAAEQQVDAHLSSAEELLESDPGKAAESIGRALRAGEAELWQRPGAAASFVYYLEALREKDRAAADRLFLDAVAQLAALPYASPYNVIILGGYVFGSPELHRTSSGGIGIVMLVRNDTSANVAPDGADSTPRLARAFLAAASDQLVGPPADQRERADVFMAAGQFLPMARQYLPERAGQLESVMQTLKPALANDRMLVRDAESFAEPPKPPDPDGRDQEKEIESEPDEGGRDISYLRLAGDLLENRRFARAREVAAKIREREARAAFGLLIDLHDGGEALERGDTTHAAEIADRMPPSAERAVLWAGLGAARAKTDRQLGLDTVVVALGDLDTVTDARRPWLSLAFAEVLAPLDTKLALELFRQAVAGFNQESARTDQRGGFLGTTITLGPRGRRYDYPFGYDIAGKDFSVSASLAGVVAALAARDPEETEAAVLALTDSDDLSEALPVLAAAWLKKLPAIPPPGK